MSKLFRHLFKTKKNKKKSSDTKLSEQNNNVRISRRSTLDASSNDASPPTKQPEEGNKKILRDNTPQEKQALNAKINQIETEKSELKAKILKLERKVESAEQSGNSDKEQAYRHALSDVHKQLSDTQREQSDIRQYLIALTVGQSNSGDGGPALLVPRLLDEIKQEQEASKRREFNRFVGDHDVWRKDSLRSRGRDPDFKERLIAYYGAQSFYGRSKKRKKVRERRGYLRCMLSGQDHPSGAVIGAHIWKFATHGFGLDHFGLHADDVNSPRNGLLLLKGIEDAFDKQKLCFIYDFLDKSFKCKVLDTSLMNTIVYPTQALKYRDLQGRRLRFMPSTHMPYRRLLSFHALCSLKHNGLVKEGYELYHGLSSEGESLDIAGVREGLAASVRSSTDSDSENDNDNEKFDESDNGIDSSTSSDKNKLGNHNKNHSVDDLLIDNLFH